MGWGVRAFVPGVERRLCDTPLYVVMLVCPEREVHSDV